MKKLRFVGIALAILILASASSNVGVFNIKSSSAAIINEEYQKYLPYTDNETQFEHAVMQPDEETLKEWVKQYNAAPVEGSNAAAAIPRSTLGTESKYSPQVLFYLPFDGNLTAWIGTTSEEPGADSWSGTRDSQDYSTDGIKGPALHLYSGQYTTFVKYQVKDNQNFYKWKGTAEFWVRPDWNIEEPIFDPADTTGRTVFQGYRPYFSVWAEDYYDPTDYNSLNCSAMCFLNIEGQHSSLERSVQYWNEGEWHHIAFTWDAVPSGLPFWNTATVTNTLYVDGKPLPAQSSQIQRIDFDKTPGWIVIGQYCGPADAQADIDELKIYARVLTEAEIEANYLKLFPVEYYAKEVVFKVSEPGAPTQKINVNVTNITSRQEISKRHIEGYFSWIVRDPKFPFAEAVPTVVNRRWLSISPGETQPVEVIFSPMHIGEYYLDCYFTESSSNIIPRFQTNESNVIPVIPRFQTNERTIRLFAISKQEQPSKPETQKLDLDGDNSICIDCTASPSAQVPYFETGGTETYQFPGWYKFRRTGTNEGDRFGYQFKVKSENLGKPHLVIVDYPALDQKQVLGWKVYTPRTMEIDILEPNGPVVQTGVFTGDEYPCRSNENLLKQHRIIFWPQNEKNLITIVNRWQGHRAAAIRIWIFPIKGDEVNGWFPRTNVVTPDDGGRLLGLWSEEPTLPGNFGVPQHFYKDDKLPYFGTPSITEFHEALKHMIDYLHYTGQNLIVYPIYFYDDPIYPSRIEGWPLWGEKGMMHPDDWFELMLKMCEVNGISVIASFTMKSIPSLEPDKYDTHGVVWTTGSLLEEKAHDIFNEVLKEYGDCPALKGLSFNVWGKPDNPINLRLRQGKLDRYFDEMLWLGYTGGNIAGSIGTCRSDLKLVISEWLPYSGTTSTDDSYWSIGYWKKHGANPQRIKYIYDQTGVRLADHALLNNISYPSIRIERVLCFSGYRRDNCGNPILRNFFTWSQYWGSCYGLFDKPDNTAVAIYNSYFEGRNDGSPFPSAVKTTGEPQDWKEFQQNVPGNELGNGFWRFAALTPGYRYFMEYYMLAMANLDPVQIGIGGSTIGTVGHDVRIEDLTTVADPIEIYGLPIQNFAKAYRALPAKSFDDVKLVGRQSGPDPSTLGMARQYDRYFYIMNKTSDYVAARLNFLPDSATSIPITDLSTGESLSVGQGRQIELRPYELRSFRFDKTGYSLKIVWLSKSY